MILISACLVGENCKYNGGNNFHEKASELLRKGLAIYVCPEELGGLPTPRDPSEIKGSNVYSINGKDVTREFIRGAEETLKIAKENNVKLAILQSRSPSCGSKVIYDGTHTGRLIEGEGVTTKLLRQNGITVVNIEEYLTGKYDHLK